MNALGILARTRQLLTQSAQEDRKTGEELRSQASTRYFEQRHLEVAAKLDKAHEDNVTHTKEGSGWSVIPLVGHWIVVSQSKENRDRAVVAEGKAGKAEVSGELYKKSMEDFQDLAKRAGESHKEILDVAKAAASEFATAQRSIFEK